MSAKFPSGGGGGGEQDLFQPEVYKVLLKYCGTFSYRTRQHDAMVQANFCVSYPICVIMRVQCIDI